MNRLSRSLARAPIAAALLAIAAAAPAAAQDTSWIRVLGSARVSMDATRAGPTRMLIPLDLDAAVAEDGVRFRLREVWMEDTPLPGGRDAFAVSSPTRPELDGTGPSLVLTVSPYAAPRPGTYTLRVEARAEGRAPRMLELSVVRTPAVVTAHPVTVEWIRGPFRSGSRPAEPLIVQETSGTSAVANLRVQATSFPGAPGATYGRGDSVALRPGGTVRIPMRLEGVPPLGNSEGVLRLRAAELASPVEVPVTLRVRRSYLVLFATILAGLGVGAFSRLYLQSYLELRRVRLQALGVLERIDRERARTADAGFLKAAAETRAALVRAMDESDPAALQEQTSRAHTDLDQAAAGLEARLAEAEASVQQLAAVGKGLFLPPQMAAVVAETGPHLEEARRAVAGRDGATASGAVARATERLTEIRRPLRGWRTDQETALGILSADAGPLPAPIAAYLREQTVPVLAAVRELPEVGPDAGAAEAEAALRVVDGVRVTEGAVFARIPGAVSAEVERVARALEGLEGRTQSEIDRLKQESEDFIRRLDEVRGDPDATIELLAGPAAGTLGESLVRAIEAQSAPLAEDETARLRELLSSGNYAEAAREAVRLRRQAAAPAATRLGSRGPSGAAGEAAAESPEFPYLPGVAPPLRFAQPASSPAIVRSFFRERPLDAVRARTKWEITRASAVRWVLLAAVLTVVAFVFYAPAFVGTWQELAGIFLWAVGLNVTLDMALEEATKIKPG
jgi:hypothetical protein